MGIIISIYWEQLFLQVESELSQLDSVMKEEFLGALGVTDSTSGLKVCFLFAFIVYLA